MEALQKIAGGIGSGLNAVGRGAENAAYYAQLADAAYAGQLPQFLANQSALLQDPTMRERILSDPGLARILGVPVAPTPGAEDINRFAAAIPPGTSAKVPTGGPQLPPLGARGLLEEAETRLLRQPGSAEEAARGALNIGGMTLEQAVAAGATGITRPLRGGGAAKWSVGPHEIPQGWAIQPGPMGSVFAVDPTGQSPSRFLFHVSQQPPGGFDQLAQMLFPGAKDRTDPRFQAWIRQQSGLPPVEKKEETPGAPTTTTTLPPTVDGLPTEGQGGALYPMVAPGAPPTTTAPSTTTTTLPQLQRPMVRPVGPVAERPTVTTTPSTALAAPAAPGARPTPTTVPAARAGAPAPAAGAAATTGVPSTTTGGPATPAPAPPGSTQALKDSAARAQARPSTQLAYGSLQQAQQAIQTALTIGPRGPTLRLAPARPQPAIVQRQLGLESTAAQAARAALRAIQRHEFSPLTMSGKPIVNIPRVTGPIWGRTIPALAEVPEELFEPQDLFWQATNVYALITHARAGITALTGVRFTEAQIDFLSGLLPSITQREDVLGAHLTRLAYFYDTLVAQQAILANMTMDQRQTFTMNMYRDIMTRPAPGEGSGGTVSIDARPKAANE